MVIVQRVYVAVVAQLLAVFEQQKNERLDWAKKPLTIKQ